MTGRTRLAVGWAIALAAALLLSLSLTRPATNPIPGGVAAASPAATPSPTAVAPAAPANPARVDDRSPRAGSGSAAYPEPPPELWPLSDAQGAALQQATERARAEFRLDVLAIGVSVDGTEGWTGASGLARDGLTPLDGHSPFAVASISKTFVAAIVLQLVEERRISLSAPVSRYLPDVPLPEGVTVQQLLQHTSGLPDLLRPMRPYLNGDTQQQFTPAQVFAQLPEPWFAPGTDWGYSNTNYILLGLIIERVTHHAFGDELRSRIIVPLGLDETGMQPTVDGPYLLSPSWATAFWTSGAMHSSADDLLRWGDALYAGHVLSPWARGRMLSWGEYDYGLGVEQIVIIDHPAYGHSGLLQGFTSLLVRLPEDNLTIAVLATGGEFDPASLLQRHTPGQPSILDLALAAAS
jgi:D-alanyl-D-alanine carboxypeptidase